MSKYKRLRLQLIFLGVFIFMGFGFFNLFFHKVLTRFYLSKILNDYVIDMNGECPVEINPELVMEEVLFIEPKTVVYIHRLPNYSKDSLNILKLKENLSKIVSDTLDNSISLAKLRNLDVVFEYYYLDKDGTNLFSLRVLFNTPLSFIEEDLKNK